MLSLCCVAFCPGETCDVVEAFELRLEAWKEAQRKLKAFYLVKTMVLAAFEPAIMGSSNAKAGETCDIVEAFELCFQAWKEAQCKLKAFYLVKTMVLATFEPARLGTIKIIKE